MNDREADSKAEDNDKYKKRIHHFLRRRVEMQGRADSLVNYLLHEPVEKGRDDGRGKPIIEVANLHKHLVGIINLLF